MICPCNYSDILVRQIPVNAISQDSELAGIDKQGVSLVISGSTPTALVARQEPQTYRDLSAVKQLPGQGDHAVHHVVFDDRLADFTFAGSVGGHATVGQDKTCSA